MNKYYTDVTIRNWPELLNHNSKLFSKGDLWTFRDQRKYSWDLKTSLEKSLEDYDISLKFAKEKEIGLLRRFKRQYFHFDNYLPEDDDYIFWLSIMQHHGCPTRLLDFTYSIFIALFFAIEQISMKDDSFSDGGFETSIWAIKSQWLKNKFIKMVKPKIKRMIKNDINLKKKETAKEILNSNYDCIININPLKLNERLIIQQGLFCIPLNVNIPFMDNLKSSINDVSDLVNIQKIKVVLTKQFLQEIYVELHRMNINRSSLFPGIEGFSQYLKSLIPLGKGFLAHDKLFYE
jgi:hypothetical protein